MAVKIIPWQRRLYTMTVASECTLLWERPSLGPYTSAGDHQKVKSESKIEHTELSISEGGACHTTI